MKNQLPIYSFLLLVFFIFSCKGSTKKAPLPVTIIETEATSESKPTPIKPLDHDSYFTPSKDTTSIYGPKNITRNILQDRKGNIWLATWEGLIRYNPDSGIFTNLTNREGLRPFRVFCILEDSGGILWFGTIGAGVFRYDPSSETFTNFTTSEGLVFDGIGCIFEDGSKNIWLGTQNGLSCLKASQRNLNKDQIVFQNFTTEDGLTDNDINSIIEDPDGILWIGTRGAACTYDGKTFTKLVNKEGKSFGNVRSVIIDQEDNIWLGGNDGLWRYSRGSFTQIATNFVGYIFEDTKRNIWTSATSPLSLNTWQLSYYAAKSLTDEKLIATQISREENMLFGITEDRQGAIWFGSLKGACRFDGESFNNFQPTENQD